MLGLGTAAQAATSSFLLGMPVLVPALRDEGASLFRASLVVAAPQAGLMVTLILWGVLADRYGERIVIVTGVSGAAATLTAAALLHGTVTLIALLMVAGGFGGSVNAASGRLVLGWFAADRRGLAMSIRQTAWPIGTALAALVLPPIAHASSAHVALLFPAALCAVCAVGVTWLVADPPRPEPDGAAGPRPGTGNPYRGSLVMHRLHLSSALMVVPQFVVAGFTVVYLVEQRGWDPVAAGRLVFFYQLAGAIGRISTGVWSDVVSSRLRPMRQLAVGSAACMLLIAVGAWTHSWTVVLAFGLGAIVTVADNGLGYTAVAELAGHDWTGRALAIQNTGQNVCGMLTAPVTAAIVGHDRYGLAFALAMVFPLVAVWTTPVRAEQDAKAGATAAEVVAGGR